MADLSNLDHSWPITKSDRECPGGHEVIGQLIEKLRREPQFNPAAAIPPADNLPPADLEVARAANWE